MHVITYCFWIFLIFCMIYFLFSLSSSFIFISASFMVWFTSSITCFAHVSAIFLHFFILLIFSLYISIASVYILQISFFSRFGFRINFTPRFNSFIVSLTYFFLCSINFTTSMFPVLTCPSCFDFSSVLYRHLHVIFLNVFLSLSSNVVFLWLINRAPLLLKFLYIIFGFSIYG